MKRENNSKPCQKSITVPKELFEDIKKMAVKENKSVNDFVADLILEKLRGLQ